MIGIPSLIGTVHLPPLLGSPRATGESAPELLRDVGLLAVREAVILEKAGFHAVILENFGDAPFYKGPVPPETIAAMAVIAAAVRDSVRIAVGVNVLRNDARGALAVSAVTGCEFIRVNVLSGVSATDQGLIEGDAAGLLRERSRLGQEVAILADVHVKHARSLSGYDGPDGIALAVEDARKRSLADGVIVTGQATGRLAEAEILEAAGAAARRAGLPCYAGSGTTPDRLSAVLRLVDGVIVGSALRKGGIAGAPLDPARAANYAEAYRRASRAGARSKSRAGGRAVKGKTLKVGRR